MAPDEPMGVPTTCRSGRALEMVFSSPAFLSYFLPLCLLSYFLIRERSRQIFFIASGLLFFSTAGGASIYVILCSVVFTFVVGQRIRNSRRRGQIFRARAFATLGYIGALSPLLYFKYSTFVVVELNNLFNFSEGLQLSDRILPLAISFYTFQCISFLSDTYSSPETVVSLQKFAAYILFFPQLIAGPIVRLADVSADLDSINRSRRDDFRIGAYRFTLGLGKKVLIGDNSGRIVAGVMSSSDSLMTSADVWLMAVAATVQIYFDFSGYSDMAIGLARMFGVRLNENFERPYTSASITEFWRRWHVSLSTWFRDYLYIPIGGNRRGNIRTYANLLVVFTLTGWWHGAAWTFLCWGWLHGAALIVERLTSRHREQSLIVALHRRIARRVWTMSIVVIGWLLFFADSLQTFLGWVVRLWPTHGWSVSPLVGLELDAISVCALVIGGLSIFSSRKVSLGRKVELLLEKPRMFIDALFILVLGLSLIRVLSTSFAPFIYFQF